MGFHGYSFVFLQECNGLYFVFIEQFDSKSSVFGDQLDSFSFVLGDQWLDQLNSLVDVFLGNLFVVVSQVDELGFGILDQFLNVADDFLHKVFNVNNFGFIDKLVGGSVGFSIQLGGQFLQVVQVGESGLLQLSDSFSGSFLQEFDLFLHIEILQFLLQFVVFGFQITHVLC